MDTTAISYWIKFAVVALIALVAILGAFRRSRGKAARHDLTVGIVGVLAVGIVIALIRPAVGYPVLGAALAAGILVGFALGRVRPLVAWLTALSAVFLVVMALFGEGKAAGAGFAAYLFGTALVLGQGLRRSPKQEPEQIAAPVRESEPEPALSGAAT